MHLAQQKVDALRCAAVPLDLASPSAASGIFGQSQFQPSSPPKTVHIRVS
jgi:hypothetical protein